MRESRRLSMVAERLVAPDDTADTGSTQPAGVALAMFDGTVRVAAAAGFRTVDTATTRVAPMTVDTHHDLASVTKIVATTASLIALVSARAVGLDDPVHRYLPHFTGGAKDAVTVRHLLLHRGGLVEWQPLYLSATDPERADDVIDGLPLVAAPDTVRRYSDLGFIMLGRIIRIAAGAPLAPAVSDLVTEPLGMTDTRFTPAAGPNVAMSSFGDDIERQMIESGSPYPTPFRGRDFTMARTQAVVNEVNDGNAFHVYRGVAGHAGLFSSLRDLVTFGIALARPDEHDDEWRTEVVREFCAPGPDEGQALGFRRYPVDIDGHRVDMLGHTGFVGCAVGFVPDRDLVVALASNRLVTDGPPTPTELLWRTACTVAAERLAEVRG
ncbi:serine hydrolase domain-containing protein [soil metagenome]